MTTKDEAQKAYLRGLSHTALADYIAQRTTSQGLEAIYARSEACRRLRLLDSMIERAG